MVETLKIFRSFFELPLWGKRTSHQNFSDHERHGGRSAKSRGRRRRRRVRRRNVDRRRTKDESVVEESFVVVVLVETTASAVAECERGRFRVNVVVFEEKFERV